MKLVSTAEQVRAMDAHVIDDLGVPGIALMETASRSVAEAVTHLHGPAARRGVVVVCGGGQNGGDGFACARWLHGWGVPVRVWALSDELSGDAATNRDACRKLQIPFVEGLEGAGLIVDAVFGTGLSRDVEGRYRDVIGAIDDHQAPVVAVDLPSGLHADTGAVMGVAVHADTTVTFGRAKLGLYGEPGADHAGRVLIADIGIGVAGVEAAAEIPDPSDLAPRWPRRAPGDHKTRSGHLLVVAGSEAMTGAAILVCRGALAAGVGLCSLVATRRMLPRLAALPAEVMVHVTGSGTFTDVPERSVLERPTALAAGPGLAAGGALPAALEEWLQHLWEQSSLPCVYDADALAACAGGAPHPRVITPHPGEAARLLDCSVGAVQADRFAAASGLAVDGRTALLKGRHTLVACEGERLSINPTNTPVLATGGSGDVLTGVIGALLARGLDGRDAARLGAWVHGRAAQLLAVERDQGWAAGDVADALPAAIEDLLVG